MTTRDRAPSRTPGPGRAMPGEAWCPVRAPQGTRGSVVTSPCSPRRWRLLPLPPSFPLLRGCCRLPGTPHWSPSLYRGASVLRGMANVRTSAPPLFPTLLSPTVAVFQLESTTEQRTELIMSFSLGRKLSPHPAQWPTGQARCPSDHGACSSQRLASGSRGVSRLASGWTGFLPQPTWPRAQASGRQPQRVSTPSPLPSGRGCVHRAKAVQGSEAS